jgi:2-polyprenyl-3-methyl-5-hydroxy-6-metoxy-1,4-benzoquinol methylase
MAKTKAKKRAARRIPGKKVKKAGKGPGVNPGRILEMVWDFGRPMIAEAALHLGVFDVMDRGAKTIDQISEQTQASKRGIKSLMDGLVAIGLVTRRGEQFKLAPDTAVFLVHGKPPFVGGLLKHVSKQLISGWMNLTECVRTGKPQKPVNQESTGGEFFATFVEDIFNLSFMPASAAAAAVIEDDDEMSVLDIAAGSGVWGIAMAKDRPNVRVTAVDWPGVIPVTRRIAERHGLGERFSYVEGDILEANLGTGHHVATLGHILHSEGEARSRRLLKRVHDAMAPGGTIVIGEFLTEEGRQGPPTSLIFDVNMLVNTEEGGTYTFKQIASWLKEAGFKRPRLMPTGGPSPLVLATA